MGIKYYIFKEAVDEEEVGPGYPQSTDMCNGYGYNSFNSIYKLGDYRNKRVPFVPNLDSLKITNNSKVTDVISCAMLGGFGFFLSRKLKEVLREFRLVEHMFYSASLVHRKQIYKDYFWLHLVSDYRQYIDYRKSEFVISQAGIPSDHLKFETYYDYLKFEREVDKFGLLKSKTIYLSFEFDYQLDLFIISQFDTNVYISERLKDAIVSQGITGVEIEETDGKIF